jgi:translation initiation factor 4E
MVCGRLGEAGAVCGIVMSVRSQEDILSVWISDASDMAASKVIKASIVEVLGLPATGKLEFKAHGAALKDQSSFRNTSTFGARKGRAGKAK